METTTNTNTPARRKITAAIIKSADLNPGDSVKGVFLGAGEREWVDKANGGEVKMIPTFFFQTSPTDQSRFTLFGDAGLKNAITSANVQENAYIEIEKQEQVDLGSGKRVNNYDIFQLN